MIRSLIPLLTLMLLSTVAQAQVFRCTVDGHTVFSDQPCAADAQEITVRPASGVGTGGAGMAAGGAGAAEAAQARSAATRENIDAMARERMVRDLGYQIGIVEARMRRQNQAMHALGKRLTVSVE